MCVGGIVMVHVYVRRGVCGGEWCVPAFSQSFGEKKIHFRNSFTCVMFPYKEVMCFHFKLT